MIFFKIYSRLKGLGEILVILILEIKPSLIIINVLGFDVISVLALSNNAPKPFPRAFLLEAIYFNIFFNIATELVEVFFIINSFARFK